ncbi:MAG: hypothetical protein ACI353_01405 [Alloprevotella sp.]
MKLLQTLTFLLVLGLCLPLQAQEKKQKTRSFYAFAYGVDLKDSTVYLSAIQQLPDLPVAKNNEPEFRSFYSKQMADYLQSSLSVPNAVTAVVYEAKKKNIEKKYALIRKKSRQSQNRNLIEITANDFRLKRVVAEEAP